MSTNSRIKQQISVHIDKHLHKKYFLHAKVHDLTFTEWVTKALRNQYKSDKHETIES